LTRAAFLGGGCSLVAASCGPRRTTFATRQVIDVVLLGGSLALTSNGERPNDTIVFRAVRSAVEAKTPVRLTALAMPGASIADVLRLQLPRIGPACRPDAFMIWTGRDDLSGSVDTASFAEDVDRLLSELSRRRAVVIVCSIPVELIVTSWDPESRGPARYLAGELNGSMASLSATHGATFVPLAGSRSPADAAAHVARALQRVAARRGARAGCSLLELDSP
jgi:hypothetical protein